MRLAAQNSVRSGRKQVSGLSKPSLRLLLGLRARLSDSYETDVRQALHEAKTARAYPRAAWDYYRDCAERELASTSKQGDVLKLLREAYAEHGVVAARASRVRLTREQAEMVVRDAPAFPLDLISSAENVLARRRRVPIGELAERGQWFA